MNSNINKLKNDLFDSVKGELEKLSPIKKFLFQTLFDRIWSIFSDDCSDNDIAQAINGLEKVNSEYVREDDFLNYDMSMRLLGYSSNRVGFSNLMKKYRIKQHTFRNQKIGFKKSELLALKSELEKEGKIGAPKMRKSKPKPTPSDKPTKKPVNERPKLSKMEKYY